MSRQTWYGPATKKRNKAVVDVKIISVDINTLVEINTVESDASTNSDNPVDSDTSMDNNDEIEKEELSIQAEAIAAGYGAEHKPNAKQFTQPWENHRSSIDRIPDDMKARIMLKAQECADADAETDKDTKKVSVLAANWKGYMIIRMLLIRRSFKTLGCGREGRMRCDRWVDGRGKNDR
jgi:hypothetical protein